MSKPLIKEIKLLSEKKQLAFFINKLFMNIIKCLNLKERYGSSLVTLQDILQKVLLNSIVGKIRKTYKSKKHFCS